jgi:hypothetical protein
MVLRTVALAFLVASVLGAAAQPVSPAPSLPLESVTVNGARQVLDAVITDYVKSITSPSRAGKITRWSQGVCPKTTGLQPKFAAYVSWRIRDIAAAIGAPVDSAQSCKPNIHVIFSDHPQALLEGLRKKSPDYLGYYDSDAQADALAQVARPIQSWYATQTRDVHGMPHADNRNAGGMVEIPIFCSIQPNCDGSTIKIPHAQVFDTTGSRLGDGLSGTFYHVLVVAEPARLRDIRVGALADFIAMLSLSQIETPKACGSLPSVLNLLAPDCPQKPEAMTAGDAAFLRGLYKATATANLRGQRGEIAYQMKQSFKGK